MKYVLILFIFISVGRCAISQNPVIDPDNSDGWILNSDLSDEFDGDALDKTKWWILGENGDYRSKWSGRAPGQFVAHNVAVKDGDLIIKSQWEPTYAFLNEMNNGVYYGGSSAAADNSKPITQACVMSEGFFKYGYMEVRCKAADAPVTCAFWTTGYRSEIDMTENYGKRPIGNPKNKPLSLEKKYRTNIISWQPINAANYTPWKTEYELPVRVADDYYVYGFEWDPDYIKIYFNEQLIKTATRQELEAKGQWVIKHPMELWVDSEVFEWYGLPAAQDLVNAAEYKVDYIRIYQKEIRGPLFDAFGFEGPFYNSGRSSNWWAAGNSAFSMSTDKALSGDVSLKYEQTTSLAANQSISAPYGTLDLPGGSNKITFKLWKEAGCEVSKVTLRVRNPFKIIGAIDISHFPEGEWVEVTQSFTRNASVLTGDKGDRLEIVIDKDDISGTSNVFYIDAIRFDNINNDYLPTLTSMKNIISNESCVYPNPVQDVLTISAPEAVAVYMYNISGAEVRSLSKVNEPMQVSVSDLKAGIYLVRIMDNEGHSTSEKIQVR